MVDISFIVVNWNTKDFLLRCLQSIQDTSIGFDYEIIVVDNASTDGSADAVRKEYPFVKLVLNSENYGYAKGCNIGMQEGIGRHFCILNSDVIILQGCTQRLLRYMRNNPGVGMCGPRTLNPDGSLQHSCCQRHSLWKTLCKALAISKVFPKSYFFSGIDMLWWDHDSTREVDIIIGAFWLIRRSAIEEVGMLDERFFMYEEDMDWCYRFAERRWKIVLVHDAQCIHIGKRSSSNDPDRFLLELRKAVLQFHRKHHGRNWTAFYRLIKIIHHTLRILSSVMRIFVKPSQWRAHLEKINRQVSCIKILLHS